MIEREEYELDGVKYIKDTIEFTTWVKRGGMLVNRSALAFDDEESYFTIWWKKYKEVLPYDFQKKIWGEVVCFSDSDRKRIIRELEEEREIVFNELYGELENGVYGVYW